MAALVQHIPNGSVPWPHSTPGPLSSLTEEILTLSPFCYGTKVPSEGGTVDEWLEISEWRSLTFPSIQPSWINLGQILGCAIQMLLFLCIQELKES